MTTTARHFPARVPRPEADVPPLQNGDHLTQAEFHRRYEAMPGDFKAELIGGKVYMSSPERRPHGRLEFCTAVVLGLYEASTPGVEGAQNLTTILSDECEPQPDLCLRIPSSGRSNVNTREYVVGPPELVIEVAHASENIDLHEKRQDYRAAGVLEYLVFCIREGRLRSFDLPNDAELPVDADGVYRSRTFPRLWIDVGAALRWDLPRLIEVVNQGLATPEHRAFAAKLDAQRRGGGQGPNVT
jgi:Uma2 family endonuclease